MTNWNMRTEPLELKDGSTIKNYHYEFNSTDRVVAKIVEDVFKAIMDISADRKTENSSEKPNNCEELQDWKDRMWAEAIVTEPTISKMEQVDKDINVRSKDEPQTENPCDGCVCDDGKHLIYCMNCKGIAVKTEPPKVEDEPQTEEHCETCRHKDECEGATYEYKNTEWWCLAYAPIDEPQTDCAWK